MNNLTFNPELLRIVRQFRGLGQTALAKDTCVSQGTLSKLEEKPCGLLEPNEEIISKLSKALKFPSSIFYESYQSFGLPLSVHPMYRKNASIGKKDIKALVVHGDAPITDQSLCVRTRFGEVLGDRGLDDARAWLEVFILANGEHNARRPLRRENRSGSRPPTSTRPLRCPRLARRRGIDDNLRRAFLIYLISHNRPMAEILAPTRKTLRRSFDAASQA